MSKKYKIGEFSAMTGLPPSKIRFYEKYGLWDVNRSETGYRYYTPEDAFKLNAFRMLLQYGFTIEEAVELLDKKHATEEFQVMLQRQREKMEWELILQKQRIHVIDTLQRSLNSEHGSDFELVDSDDYLYARASIGRDFTEAQKDRELIADMVNLLPVTMYARILTKEDLLSDRSTINPDYTIALPCKKRAYIGKFQQYGLKRLTLGKCVRFTRKLNRSESLQKSNFAKLFTYLKDHGYEIRGDGLIIPYFLNLDENHRDLETVFIPVR